MTGLIVLAVSVFVGAFGVFMSHSERIWCRKVRHRWEPVLGFVTFFTLALAAGLSAPLPFHRIATSTYAVKREAIQSTLDAVRASGVPNETAAIVKEIVEFNQQLAVNQYWRAHFRGWIHPIVEDVEPVR